MRSSVVGLMLAIGAPAAVHGQVISTADLLDVCTRADMHWIDFCNGFFQAVHDVGNTAGEVCVPPGTTRVAMVEAFEDDARRMLTLNPALGDEPGSEVARAILAEAFPCR